MIDRRVAGLPLEHILGWAEFCGLRIAVDDGVFVPRQRTEFLVQQAAGLAGRVDAAVLASRTLRPGSRSSLTCVAAQGQWVSHWRAAVGPDRAARGGHRSQRPCAAPRRNVDPVGGRVYQGDLYDALPGALRGRVDILVANAPYVPTEEIDMMPPEARLFEPPVALDGGPDGLDLQRRVTAGAAAVAGAGRPPADRDQRTTGADHPRHLCARGTRRARREL